MVVLGDRKNIKQIAEAFEHQYGKKPTLRQLGSLEDLYAHMQKARDQEPSNAMAWIPLCVTNPSFHPTFK